jgi:hypothetical protein
MILCPRNQEILTSASFGSPRSLYPCVCEPRHGRLRIPQPSSHGHRGASRRFRCPHLDGRNARRGGQPHQQSDQDCVARKVLYILREGDLAWAGATSLLALTPRRVKRLKSSPVRCTAAERSRLLPAFSVAACEVKLSHSQLGAPSVSCSSKLGLNGRAFLGPSDPYWNIQNSLVQVAVLAVTVHSSFPGDSFLA